MEIPTNRTQSPPSRHRRQAMRGGLGSAAGSTARVLWLPALLAAAAVLAYHLFSMPATAEPNPAPPAVAQLQVESEQQPHLPEGAPAEPEYDPSEQEPPADDIPADAQERDQPEGRAAPRGTVSSRGGVRSPEPAPVPAPEARESLGDRIASIAQQYLGYRYVWAGSSPRIGFDCSGFTRYVYGEEGIGIPRDLRGQLNSGPRIDRADLVPGDLVFFENTYTWGLSHSGIYTGDSNFVHAVDTGVGVATNSLKERFWSSRFLAGARPWKADGE